MLDCLSVRPAASARLPTPNISYNSAFAAATDAGWLYVTSPEGVYRIALGDLERYYQDGGRLLADMVVQTGGSRTLAPCARACQRRCTGTDYAGQRRSLVPTALRMACCVWTPDVLRRSSLSPPAVIETD